jgi:hypothetical protein
MGADPAARAARSGLILSGADPRAVLRDVAPAIHFMTTRNAQK